LTNLIIRFKFSQSTVLGAGLFFLMILHATFRGIHSDLDAVVYAGFLKEVSDLSLFEFLLRLHDSGWVFQIRDDSIARFEWGFALFSWATTLFGYSLPLSFGLIASFSLIPKFIVLRQYTNSPSFGALWYFAICYPVLEMSAMRAGVAAAILMMYIGLLINGRYFKYFFVIIFAASFHLSALIGLLLVAGRFIEKFRSPWIVVLGVSLLIFILQYVILGMFVQYFPKLNEYGSEAESGGLYSKINVINTVTVLMSFVYLLYIFNLRNRARVSCEYIWSMFFLIPFFALFAFITFPIVAARLFELLCVFQIFFVSFPKLIFFRNKVVLGVGVIIISFLLIVNQQFRIQNVNLLYPAYPPSQMMLEYFDLKVGSDKRLYELWQEDFE